MPVENRARVGNLCLSGELALGLSHRIVGAPDAGGLRAVALGAGGDLKAPQLLLGQRGLLVGVVLLASQQTPEQARGELRQLGVRGGGDARSRARCRIFHLARERSSSRKCRSHRTAARPGRNLGSRQDRVDEGLPRPRRGSYCRRTARSGEGRWPRSVRAAKEKIEEKIETCKTKM